jgi:hypothetical protein
MRRLSLFLSFVACHTEPVSSPAAYGDAFGDYADDVCGCEWPIVYTRPLLPEVQYSTPDECRADLAVNEDTAKCLEQASEGRPETEAAFDCLADVLKQASECLAKHPCGDAGRSECFDAADVNTCSGPAEDLALSCIAAKEQSAIHLHRKACRVGGC